MFAVPREKLARNSEAAYPEFGGELGLALIAESALGEGLRGTSTAADRYQVVHHVDAEALRDPAASGRSHLENGPGISAETILRISCDTSLVRIVEGSGASPFPTWLGEPMNTSAAVGWLLGKRYM